MDDLSKPSSEFGEELSDTCSGDTWSGDGDCDDTISLCSWTTDCTDAFMEPRNIPSGFAFEAIQEDSMMSNMPQPPPFSPECQTMPPAPGIWYESVMVPMTYCYYVMPDRSTVGQSRYPMSRPQWQNAGKWKATQSRQQGKTKHGQDGTAGAKSAKGKRKPSESNCDNTEPTTIILRNFPVDYTRDMLLETLDGEGFSGEYNFLHLPIDFLTKVGLGYALVNMVSHRAAQSIQKYFNGFKNWKVPCDNACEVSWNSPHQGLAAHIERYRNSPLMHSSVPESYRPALLENGVRIDFPAPTSRIRPPRIRRAKEERGQRIEEDALETA